MVIAPPSAPVKSSLKSKLRGFAVAKGSTEETDERGGSFSERGAFSRSDGLDGSDSSSALCLIEEVRLGLFATVSSLS